jgi:hypothetical protein
MMTMLGEIMHSKIIFYLQTHLMFKVENSCTFVMVDAVTDFYCFGMAFVCQEILTILYHLDCMRWRLNKILSI